MFVRSEFPVVPYLLRPRSGFKFVRDNPASESEYLMQAGDSLIARDITSKMPKNIMEPHVRER